jgi:hypothetical protein
MVVQQPAHERGYIMLYGDTELVCKDSESKSECDSKGANEASEKRTVGAQRRGSSGSTHA